MPSLGDGATHPGSGNNVLPLYCGFEGGPNSSRLADGGGYLTGHAILGALHLADGDHLRAIAEFDEVICLDPGNAIAFKQRAAPRYMAGRYAEAWADAERCRQPSLGLDARFLADVLQRLDR